MSDYVLGSDAVVDLEDIWDYIATDSANAAERWVAKLFDAFEEIGRMPGIGRQRQDLTAYPVLFWTGRSVFDHLPCGVGPSCRDRRGHSRISRHPIIPSTQTALTSGAILTAGSSAEFLPRVSQLDTKIRRRAFASVTAPPPSS